jgi:hypothetical protein
MQRFRIITLIGSFVIVSLLLACGGGGGGGGSSQTPPAAATRSFYMGSTPYFARPGVNGPDWRFENMGERDLLSLHVDDFWGVPWDYCNASGCSNLPASWRTSWETLAANARATGKPIYLAVSPLGDRKTLARRVKADGTLEDNWAPVDGNGCYQFATDANAASYKAAYIGFMKYLVGLVGPSFLSPAIEMNMPFTSCTGQKAAWIAWYADVHAAIKAAYPTLPVFGTFQMEHMYGTANAAAACAGGLTYAQCFSQRLTEALTVPGDRMAYSTYPSGWRYGNGHYPTDTYATTRDATTRPIWVSETGWPTVPFLTSYPHGGSGSCGTAVLPAAATSDSEQAAYMGWLLGEAQNQGVEAVIWWLNRDYLDAPVAATCSCDPAASDTCVLADAFYNAGESVAAGSGPTFEYILRVFGNMALYNYNGTPHTAQTTWHSWLTRTRQ